MPSIPVFILSWERPVYLWVTLDSLFRHSPSNARFTLIDNGSKHPMVREVIEGFQRRAMFENVIFASENDPLRIRDLVMSQISQLPKYFAFVEGDVEILPGVQTWLDEYFELMEAHPTLAYVGSLISPGDFVDIEQVQKTVEDQAKERIERLLKHNSPERSYPQDSSVRLDTTLNPPGRICMIRTDAIRPIGMLPDHLMASNLRLRGFEVGIATRVRHRHLSLLHIFDEPDYDYAARDDFFSNSSITRP